MITRSALKLRNLALFFIMLLAVTGCSSKPASPDAVYYLVRHAEKQLDVKNPPLTEEGKERALDLAKLLEDVPLTAIYSTDYVRTQDTAAPVADAKGLNVISYDPSDLAAFSTELLSEDGYILVSGHSNTTPPLAGHLGAEPGTPIVEATEYNRLYVITRRGDTVTGEIRTFGK